MNHKYPFSVFLLIFLFSCQEDITPSWLAVDTFDFKTNLTVEGEPTHDIVDAWVYIDNKSMGVWELPFKMPVLEEGEHEVRIYAGIKNNGISATRTDYEFYTEYAQSITLTKEQVFTVKPVFEYNVNTVFEAREDFEDVGTILGPNNDLDTTKIELISKSDFPDIVKYGNNCGRIKLTSIDSTFRLYTNMNISIPKSKIYLEMDYLTTNSFQMGIISEEGTSDNPYPAYAGVNPKEFEWKKIYFDLTDEVHLNLNATSFEYYIESTLDSGNSEAYIYFDNLKIVHF